MAQKRIGRFIYKTRSDKNISQQELADALNVLPGTVNAWEEGIVYPSMELLPKLTEALGVTMNDLFTGSNAPVKEKPQAAEITEEEPEKEQEELTFIEFKIPIEEIDDENREEEEVKPERRTFHLIKDVIFGRRRGKLSKKD